MAVVRVGTWRGWPLVFCALVGAILLDSAGFLPVADAHEYGWVHIGGPARPSGTTRYGSAVAVDDLTVVAVPASCASGSPLATIDRRENFAWVRQATLTLPGKAGCSTTGGFVDMSADRIVVGADGADTTFALGSGSAYVFVRAGTSWSLEAELLPGGLATGDQYGASVSMDGDAIAVGAPGTNGQRGAVHLFQRFGSGWAHEATLTAPDAAPLDRFGSVALDGDSVLVGVPGDDGKRGTARLFERVDLMWTQVQVLHASNEAANRQYGAAVAMDDGYAVVGAPYPGDPEEAGWAYFLRDDGGSWSETGRDTGIDGALFGAAVAMAGARALVGIPSPAGGPTYLGYAKFYERQSPTLWFPAQVYNGVGGGRLGAALAVGSELVALGEPNAASGAGAVRTYYIAPSIVFLTPLSPECAAGGAVVRLNAAQTHGHDRPLNILWTLDPPVALDDPFSLTPSAWFAAGSTTRVRLTVDDGIALVTSTERTITVRDTIDPAVTLTRPRAGMQYRDDVESPGPLGLSIVDGWVTARADASDACGLVGVTFHLDGDTVTDTTPPFEAVYESSGLGRGTVRAEAVDVSNRRASDSHSFLTL